MSASNGYWFVGNDKTKVFSSKSGTYVPVTDPTYVAWVNAGGKTAIMSDENALVRYLTRLGVPLGDLQNTADLPSVPLWALKAALAASNGTDREAAYTTWITANKATRVNLFYQWQCGNNVERKSALIASIANNTGMTPAQMTAVYRDAQKRANGAGVS